MVAGKPSAVLQHAKRVRTITDTRVCVVSGQARNNCGGDHSNGRGVDLQEFSQELAIVEVDIVVANDHPFGSPVLGKVLTESPFCASEVAAVLLRSRQVYVLITGDRLPNATYRTIVRIVVNDHYVAGVEAFESGYAVQEL